LDRLDLEALPAGAQAKLRRRRDELEALLAATAPDTAPLLVEAHARLNRSLGNAELIALRRRHVETGSMRRLPGDESLLSGESEPRGHGRWA
jgi:hypothetical protein